MADLVVLSFPTMSAADEVIPQLDSLQRENLLQLADWARVVRHDDGKVEVQQAHIRRPLAPRAEPSGACSLA